MDRNELRLSLFEVNELEKTRYSKKDLNLLDEKFHLELVNSKEEGVYLFSNDDKKINQNIIISKQPRFTYIPNHIHTYMELNYIYSGSCTQIVNGKTIELHQGDILLVDKNVQHRPLELEKNDIVINLFIETEFLRPSFISRLSNKGIINEFIFKALSEVSERENYIIFSDNQEKEKISDIMDNLMCEYFHPTFNSEEIFQSYIVILFSILVRDETFETNMVVKKDGSEEVVSLVDFLKYIEEKFDCCTLQSMGEHFSFNPNYLSNLLKKKTGRSFKELLLQEKIKHAVVLLTNTTLPINEIANNVGFSNISFFYKKFHESYGFTPLDYRKQLNR